MKKKPSSSIFRRDPKEEIMNRARKGAFDRNPLLTNPHRVVCKACGFAQKIRCGTEISCSPVSLKYLLFTATEKQKLKNMYV